MDTTGEQSQQEALIHLLRSGKTPREAAVELGKSIPSSYKWRAHSFQIAQNVAAFFASSFNMLAHVAQLIMCPPGLCSKVQNPVDNCVVDVHSCLHKVNSKTGLSHMTQACFQIWYLLVIWFCGGRTEWAYRSEWWGWSVQWLLSYHLPTHDQLNRTTRDYPPVLCDSIVISLSGMR
jgi:hypothetical protein